MHSCPEEGEISLVKEDRERLPGGSYSWTDLKDEGSCPMEGLDKDMTRRGLAA